MKNSLFSSYLSGIFDREQQGESYRNILRYFIPEFISAVLLYSLPILLDSFFISQISMVSYATLGAANNFIHIIIKMAEGISIGTVVLTGQFNGRKEYTQAGTTLKDTFWITCIVGTCFAILLYSCAGWIYWWYGVADELIPAGIPYLQLRALNVLLMFIYMAFIGFLRGIKNVRAPMALFVLGALFFVVSDYVLIFGKLGLPALGLNGSAIASIIQYAVMLLGAVGYITYHPGLRKYGITLASSITKKSYIQRLVKISWPIVVDKSIFAAAYIWLCKMICPMGAAPLATFNIIKDMERCAFLPAMACAQVITLLASNYRGSENWTGIKTNIKKIAFLASTLVFIILLTFASYPEQIIRLFDKQNQFSPMAIQAFPVISVLVFFDLIQLILSGALRGTGNVRSVMLVRLGICSLYFIPVSWLIAHAPISNDVLKFILIYGSFYVGNGLMSLIYIKKLHGDSWKKPPLDKG